MLLVRLVAALIACLLPAAALAECRPGALAAFPEHAGVHLPAGASGAVPLVLLLHASGGTGADTLHYTHLAETADRHGFAVVAPDGAIPLDDGFVWNIPGVPSVAGRLPPPGARDDVAYLTGLVDRLVATGCVDRARVYVTGISGGGRMTSLLGCADARRFAAIAPVVGLRAGRPLAADPTRPDPATCRAAVPLPVLAFAGDADTVNPVAGGGGLYWRYSQAAALRRWAALDGCSAPYERPVAAGVIEQGYARCRGGATVAVRTTHGGQHSWSVADNEAMWAFFAQHHR